MTDFRNSSGGNVGLYEVVRFSLNLISLEEKKEEINQLNPNEQNRLYRQVEEAK